jgi:hypothetical protein
MTAGARDGAARRARRLRTFAGGLVIAAGAGVFFWGVGQQTQREAAPDAERADVRVVSRVPVEDDDGAAQAVSAADFHGPAHAPRGRTWYVSADHPERGSGDRDDPWNDLQFALCELGPGDRLLIAPGTYPGTVAIDGDCSHGTPNRPIEVVAAPGASIVGPDTREPIDRATVHVARSHWHLYELEVEPQWTRPGVRLAPGVTGIRLVGFHVLKGIGSGIEIAHAVSDVVVDGGHLHHLGTLRGTQRDFRDPETAGVLIAPGTAAITVADVEIHHLEGDAVRVVAPEAYRAESGLPEARDVTVRGISGRALFGEWD